MTAICQWSHNDCANFQSHGKWTTNNGQQKMPSVGSLCSGWALGSNHRQYFTFFSISKKMGQNRYKKVK
jgi:hypothetical protein